MRAVLAIVGLVIATIPAMADSNLRPDEIRAIFTTGMPFSAASASGKESTMLLKANGTALTVPRGQTKGELGKWRLSNRGYCSAWGSASEQCYTIAFLDGRYSVNRSDGSVVAYWFKPAVPLPKKTEIATDVPSEPTEKKGWLRRLLPW